MAEPDEEKIASLRNAIAEELAQKENVDVNDYLDGKDKSYAAIKVKLKDKESKREIIFCLVLSKQKLKIEKLITYVGKTNEPTPFSTNIPWDEFLNNMFMVYDGSNTDHAGIVRFNNDFQTGINLNTMPMLLQYVENKNRGGLITDLTNIVDHYATLKNISLAADGEFVGAVDYIYHERHQELDKRKETNNESDDNIADDAVEELIRENEAKKSVIYLDGYVPISPTKGHAVNYFSSGDIIHVKLNGMDQQSLDFLTRVGGIDEETERVKMIEGTISSVSINQDGAYVFDIELADGYFCRVDVEKGTNLSAPSMPSLLNDEMEKVARSSRMRTILLVTALGLAAGGIGLFFLLS